MSQYADKGELSDLGLRTGALEEITDETLDEHLQAASGIIDSYIGARYTLPLGTPYPMVLKRVCVTIAVYEILLWRGFNPETYDTNYKDQYTWAMDWLDKVNRGLIGIPGIITTPSPGGDSMSSPLVYSRPMRGW